MKNRLLLIMLLLLSSLSFTSCNKTQINQTDDSIIKDTYVKDHFDKTEVTIEMRDGVKLHTTVYSPKDTSKSYPILLKRTPYSCKPYGENEYPSKIGPNKYMMKQGYIVVYQDVRGRWMSEGTYDNMRAYIPNKQSKKDIDESSDTYDTIDWLVKNVKNNNGKVGTWGISYPGFYATYSTIDAHPALKAASPQACIGDFFFDDFHHNGAYLLSYFRATALFGTPKDQPIDTAWYKVPDLKTEDQYQFFLDAGPLSNLNKYFQYETVDDPGLKKENLVDDFFWQELIDHPNYDSVWQKKGIIQHLKNIKPSVATMVVGGWFDAEDLYGPLETYKTIEKYNDASHAMDVWSSHIKSFGLGDYLGYDLTIGKKGNIPDGAYYDKWYPDFKWQATTTLSNAIGQGEVLVTPIQLANMTAAIANRGYYYTPHIIKHIEGKAIDTAYTTKHYTTIDKRHFEPVIEGLFDVYNKGTAHFLQVPGIEICGKTGTAENFTKIDGVRTQLTDHSIFIAFAPKDNPKIAIAVLVENGYFGARFAGRIASLMIEKYIKGTITRTDLEQWVMERTLEHEYDKPFSGEPFGINAKSQIMLVKDYELQKKKVKTNQRNIQ